jgi:hypothetical protein
VQADPDTHINNNNKKKLQKQIKGVLGMQITESTMLSKKHILFLIRGCVWYEVEKFG